MRNRLRRRIENSPNSRQYFRRNSKLGQSISIKTSPSYCIVLPNAVVLQSSFRISLLLRGAVQQSEAIKLEVSDAGGCTARGQSVTVVDEFLYLGVIAMVALELEAGRRASTRWGEQSVSCTCCVRVVFSTSVRPWRTS